VVADLPVGENLQDHVMGDGVEFYTPYPGVSISMANADSFFSSWIYNIFGTGIQYHRVIYRNPLTLLFQDFRSESVVDLRRRGGEGDRIPPYSKVGGFSGGPHPACFAKFNEDPIGTRSEKNWKSRNCFKWPCNAIRVVLVCKYSLSLLTSELP